jgi:transposase-like protein
MPPKRTISGPDPSNQEGRILLAIQAYRNNEITSIREAARRFGVPRTTLRHRLAGQTYRPTTRANNTKLTQLEEESLKIWLLSMDDRGIAADHALIREMANILLAKRGEDPI